MAFAFANSCQMSSDRQQDIDYFSENYHVTLASLREARKQATRYHKEWKAKGHPMDGLLYRSFAHWTAETSRLSWDLASWDSILRTLISAEEFKMMLKKGAKPAKRERIPSRDLSSRHEMHAPSLLPAGPDARQSKNDKQLGTGDIEVGLREPLLPGEADGPINQMQQQVSAESSCVMQ